MRNGLRNTPGWGEERTRSGLKADMGLTYDTAAAALGVSRGAYADWLAGRSRTNGKPVGLDRRTSLACAALAAGLEPWPANQVAKH
jgi:hypothetical protein